MGPVVAFVADKAKDKVKEFVKKWVLDRVMENMSDGPTALGPIRTDLDDVEVEVQRYCATIQVSSPLAVAPRGSYRDMANACVYTITTDEISATDEMLTDLTKVRDRLARIEQGTSARNAARIMSGQVGQGEEEQYFADVYGRPAGSSASDPRNLSVMESAMQVSSNKLMMQQKLLVLQTLAHSTEKRVDDLIASLNGARTILSQNTELFRELSVQCSDWMVSLQGGAR